MRDQRNKGSWLVKDFCLREKLRRLKNVGFEQLCSSKLAWSSMGRKEQVETSPYLDVHWLNV